MLLALIHLLIFKGKYYMFLLSRRNICIERLSVILFNTFNVKSSIDP